jgi:hypothetical protein
MEVSAQPPPSRRRQNASLKVDDCDGELDHLQEVVKDLIERAEINPKVRIGSSRRLRTGKVRCKRVVSATVPHPIYVQWSGPKADRIKAPS